MRTPSFLWILIPAALTTNGCSTEDVENRDRWFPLKVVITEFDGVPVQVRLDNEVIFDDVARMGADHDVIIDRIVTSYPPVVEINVRYEDVNHSESITVSANCNAVYVSPLQGALIDYADECFLWLE